MVVEFGGTTTVVFAGGGGLLLLMQPDSIAAATNRVLIIFIPVSAIDRTAHIFKQGAHGHTGWMPQAAMGLAPRRVSSAFLHHKVHIDFA